MKQYKLREIVDNRVYNLTLEQMRTVEANLRARYGEQVRTNPQWIDLTERIAWAEHRPQTLTR